MPGRSWVTIPDDCAARHFSVGVKLFRFSSFEQVIMVVTPALAYLHVRAGVERISLRTPMRSTLLPDGVCQMVSARWRKRIFSAADSSRVFDAGCDSWAGLGWAEF